jgi:hypothetical protein
LFQVPVSSISGPVPVAADMKIIYLFAFRRVLACWLRSPPRRPPDVVVLKAQAQHSRKAATTRPPSGSSAFGAFAEVGC